MQNTISQSKQPQIISKEDEKIVQTIRNLLAEHNSYFYEFRIFLRYIDQYLLDRFGCGLPFYNFSGERDRIHILSPQEFENLLRELNRNNNRHSRLPRFEKNYDNKRAK